MKAPAFGLVSAFGNVKPKSPVVFWDFHDSVRLGSTVLSVLQSRDASYFTAPDGQSLTQRPNIALYSGATLGTAWSANPGWFTADGATSNRCFRYLLSAGAAFANALTLASGALLWWGQIFTPSVLSSIAETFLMVGRDGSGRAWGVQWDGADKRLRVRLTDDALTVQTIAANANVLNAINTLFNLAVYIDNRAGYKTVQFYVNGATNLAVGITVAAVNYGDINANAAISLCASFIGTTPVNPLNMQIRRQGVINFGQTPPNNINTIVNKLHARACVPGWEFNGI